MIHNKITERTKPENEMQTTTTEQARSIHPELTIPTPTRYAISHGVTVRAGAIVSSAWDGKKRTIPTDAVLEVFSRRFDGTSINVDVNGKSYCVAAGDYTENRGN